MQRRPIQRIALVGAPALSRAGNVLWWSTVAWLLVGPIVVSALLGPTGPSSPANVPRSVVVVSVAVGPAFVLSYFPGWLGRFRPFRWILTPTQPGATLDEGGLTLSIPGSGTVQFGWDDIASMAPEEAWFRRSFVTNANLVDLRAPDGRVLVAVPPSVYGRLTPAGRRWRSGPRTLAEHVVVARPDRFRFLEAERLPYLWFTLIEPTASSSGGRGQASTGTLA